MDEDGCDVIGDVHGHADELVELLGLLGYARRGGAMRHPRRRAIFVGDLIDRGPRQREVVDLARDMCHAGAALAILGNHEFNALGWATPDGARGFLRPHVERNRRQHAQFLRQFGEGSPAHEEALRWFATLPVWLDLPGLRVVHACWHAPSQRALAPCLDDGERFTEEGLRAAFRRGGDAFDAAEILLKGPEEPLPPGVSFADADGHARAQARVRWWDPEATTFRRAALGVGAESLPDAPLARSWRYDEPIPVFFGHYWLAGAIAAPAPHAACLDYSVARGGRLVAYRWSGERAIDPQRFVSVACASYVNET